MQYNDENLWEALMNFARNHWLFGLMAAAGGLIAVLKSDRRLNRRQICKTLAVSAIAGCGLTPLFAHALGFPDNVAPSLACFIGVVSDKAIDALWLRLKQKLNHHQE